MKKLSTEATSQLSAGYDRCVPYHVYNTQTINDPGAMFADLIIFQGKAYMCW